METEWNVLGEPVEDPHQFLTVVHFTPPAQHTAITTTPLMPSATPTQPHPPTHAHSYAGSSTPVHGRTTLITLCISSKMTAPLSGTQVCVEGSWEGEMGNCLSLGTY